MLFFSSPLHFFFLQFGLLEPEEDGRSNDTLSEIPSDANFPCLDFNSFSTCLDNIDMWRQDVSKSHILDTNFTEGALTEAGSTSMESYCLFPNGHGQLSMPEYAENQSAGIKETEYAGSLPTRTSPTDGTFSNLESVSTISTFSPGMEPVTASTSHGFPALDAPVLSTPVYENIDPSTNSSNGSRPKPSADFSHSRVHQHLPGCPHASKTWFPPSVSGPQLTINSQGQQINTNHGQYMRFGDWQHQASNTHPAQIPGINPATLRNTMHDTTRFYAQDANKQTNEQPGPGPIPHSTPLQIPQ